MYFEEEKHMDLKVKMKWREKKRDGSVFDFGKPKMKRNKRHDLLLLLGLSWTERRMDYDFSNDLRGK